MIRIIIADDEVAVLDLEQKLISSFGEDYQIVDRATEIMDIIDTWCRQGFHFMNTARALHVHKSTLTYLHGFKNIPIGLEEALEGKKIGDTFSVAVPPEKGYGIRDEKMVFTLPKENFLSKMGDDDELNEVQQDIKVGMEFDAHISGVQSYGIYCEIDENHCEGLVGMHDLDGDYYEFDEKNYQLVGRRHHRKYQLGDAIRIKVARANVERRQLDFILAD